MLFSERINNARLQPAALHKKKKNPCLDPASSCAATSMAFENKAMDE